MFPVIELAARIAERRKESVIRVCTYANLSICISHYLY